MLNSNLTQQQIDDLNNKYLALNTAYINNTTTHINPVEERLIRIENMLEELLKEKIAMKKLKS